jgi:hypothetical protein
LIIFNIFFAKQATLMRMSPNLAPGKPYQSGRLCTVDLPVLTVVDQTLFILKIINILLQNQLPK